MIRGRLRYSRRGAGVNFFWGSFGSQQDAAWTFGPEFSRCAVGVSHNPILPREALLGMPETSAKEPKKGVKGDLWGRDWGAAEIFHRNWA